MANKTRVLFLLLSGLFFSCTGNKETRIVAIQPFGDFKKELCDTLKYSIEKYYKFQVHILPAIQLPAKAFVNIKSPRYRADDLIVFLKGMKPDSVDYILGLTEKDISFTKRDENGEVKKPENRYSDFGIFGLAFRPGASSVVSSFRLNKNHNEFISRIKKVCLHELGHNLGLEHCADQNCFMRSAAEKIKTIDQVKLKLCLACKEKI